MNDQMLAGVRWLVDLGRKAQENQFFHSLVTSLVAGAIVAAVTYGIVALLTPEPNRGICRSGQVIRPGEFCRVPNLLVPFLVTEGSAYTPWRTPVDATEVQNMFIKIDDDEYNKWTFQAFVMDDGAWEIVAAGPWDNQGNCAAGSILIAGQFCELGGTNIPFRVYGTDRLYHTDHKIRELCPIDPDNCRSLHVNGYGVLFQFVGDESDPLTRVPNQHNGRLNAQRVRCVDPVDGDTVLFEAERRPEADKEGPSDAWRIITATLKLDGDENSTDENDVDKVLNCMPGAGEDAP